MVRKVLKNLLDKLGILSICLVGGYTIGGIFKLDMQPIIIIGLSAYILIHLFVSVCIDAYLSREPPVKDSKPAELQESAIDDQQSKEPEKTMVITDEDIGVSDPSYESEFLSKISSQKPTPSPNKPSTDISEIFGDGYGEDY